MSNPQRPLCDADYTDPAAKVNEGIVDGRAEGREPAQAPVALDTYIDEDASASSQHAADTLIGATSADVHDHLGHPGQGMSSKELRNDGRPKRKRYGLGVEQFGEGGGGNGGRGDGSRKLDGASERRFVTQKAEFRKEPEEQL